MGQSTTPLKLKIVHFFKTNKAVERLLTMDINWVFVYLLIVFFLDFPWWQRILVAIGSYYTYNFLIKDIIRIRRAR